jgi:hypothetical protein
VNISAAAVISNYAGFSIYGTSELGARRRVGIARRRTKAAWHQSCQACSRDRFAPSSAVERAKNHIADYDRSSGKFLRFVETMNGRQPGGPDKAADAIIGAVESDAPPLRLVLGKYANDKVRKKLATAAKDKKTMSFIMPQKAVEKGVPKPAGDSVTLGKVDAARFAVMRFGGDRTAENEKTGIEKLKTWLSAQKIPEKGEPIFAYYDPSWTPLFLRMEMTPGHR